MQPFSGVNIVLFFSHLLPESRRFLFQWSVNTNWRFLSCLSWIGKRKTLKISDAIGFIQNVEWNRIKVNLVFYPSHLYWLSCSDASCGAVQVAGHTDTALSMRSACSQTGGPLCRLTHLPPPSVFMTTHWNPVHSTGIMFAFQRRRIQRI